VGVNTVAGTSRASLQEMMGKDDQTNVNGKKYKLSIWFGESEEGGF
jgi:hypothetical protein